MVQLTAGLANTCVNVSYMLLEIMSAPPKMETYNYDHVLHGNYALALQLHRQMRKTKSRMTNK